MRVVVAGGGIGGLALAQGLRRHDVDVVVLERDADLADTGGYKLHLDPGACAALDTLLTDDLGARLRACSVVDEDFLLVVRGHRGRLLARAGDDTPGPSLDVDRLSLRLLLADGLGPRLRTGARCVGYEESPTEVRVRLDDGATVPGDVLVIADGAGSALAPALAGGPTATPTGLVGVAGRLPLDQAPATTRELLAQGSTLAVGPGGVGMFAAAHAPGVAGPTVIWGLISVAGHIPGRLADVPPDALLERATGLLQRLRWTGALAGLPSHTAPSTVAGFRFLAADPARIGSWASRRVTALGDAVHAMPPTGGRGAATAVRDAALLTEVLLAARDGGRPLPAALEDYRTRMRPYAARAVRESLQPVRWIRASATPAGRLLTRAGLPAAAGIQRLTAQLPRIRSATRPAAGSKIIE